MHFLTIQNFVASIIILICVNIFEKSVLPVSSLIAIDNELVRGHPCIKQSKKIICSFEGSQFSNLHKAAISNFSLKLGPNMYYRKFTVPLNHDQKMEVSQFPITTTTSSKTISKTKTHVIYFTKQYDGSNGGQNVFDLNDNDEHRFMHDTNVEENIIDDSRQVKKIKKKRINMFIEENKALIRRMFGDYHEEGDDHHNYNEFIYHTDSRDHYSSFHDGPSGKTRPKRSLKPTPVSSNKVDSCESSVEIVTPYWASNSAGKIRAIVNTQHLQQAIQQEVCQAAQTKRCNNDCACEQKYKWHRLLAYDPDDDCKGIFMDWFLFPSCCVCRCTKF